MGCVVASCVALVLLASAVHGGITPEEKAAALKEKEVPYDTAAATGHATKVKAEAEKALGIKGNLVRLSSGLIDNRAVAVAALSVLSLVIKAVVVVVGYRFRGSNMFGQIS